MDYEHKTYTVNGVSFEMISVEGGTFTMGATSEQLSDADKDEYPAHEITLSNYAIGKTLVTQELWTAVMGNNPSRYKGDFRPLLSRIIGYLQGEDSSEFNGDKRPVESVSWNDSQEFIKRLNSLTGCNFRLPTEEEWEYAARGGNKSKGFKFAGSDNIDEVAWNRDNADKQTHNVATKKANELGLYDMSGNVWEMCNEYYEPTCTSWDFTPFFGARGGSYIGDPMDCRVSARIASTREDSNPFIGFRLASDFDLINK